MENDSPFDWRNIFADQIKQITSDILIAYLEKTGWQRKCTRPADGVPGMFRIYSKPGVLSISVPRVLEACGPAWQWFDDYREGAIRNLVGAEDRPITNVLEDVLACKEGAS